MVKEYESYYKDEKYYKLDKQELIALNTWQIQKLKKLFEKMTDKINEMEGLLCH